MSPDGSLGAGFLPDSFLLASFGGSLRSRFGAPGADSGPRGLVGVELELEPELEPLELEPAAAGLRQAAMAWPSLLPTSAHLPANWMRCSMKRFFCNQSQNQSGERLISTDYLREEALVLGLFQLELGDEPFVVVLHVASQRGQLSHGHGQRLGVLEGVADEVQHLVEGPQQNFVRNGLESGTVFLPDQSRVTVNATTISRNPVQLGITQVSLASHTSQAAAESRRTRTENRVPDAHKLQGNSAASRRSNESYGRRRTR